MFTLITSLISFTSGYLIGKYNDAHLLAFVDKMFEKAKNLDIDLRQVLLDVLESAESTDSDEIKTNFLKIIDTIKTKTTEIVSEENVEGSFEKIKEGISQVKKHLTDKK